MFTHCNMIRHDCLVKSLIILLLCLGSTHNNIIEISVLTKSKMLNYYDQLFSRKLGGCSSIVSVPVRSHVLLALR